MKPYGVKRKEAGGQCMYASRGCRCDKRKLGKKSHRQLVKSRERRKNKVDTRSAINAFREDVVNNLTYELKFW